MAKRKRGNNDHHLPDQVPSKKSLTAEKSFTYPDTIHLQLITGSYDRVLHGIIATIPLPSDANSTTPLRVQFVDNFLFNAHNSAIRCLAISPQQSLGVQSPGQRLILATGGTDERINLYHVSTTLPHPDRKPLPSLSLALQPGNPKNQEIGSLLHHSSGINILHFSNKSKLLSGSDDNTISISRVRDWTVLSTIKIPTPKTQGRPSGDTAPSGGVPAGVNDFAVHPSMKLMISVGKGERCMRLWNLVTGKKAGVLAFEKELLQSVGETKCTRGEGRKVEWNCEGLDFAVAFERGAVVFGMVFTGCHVHQVPRKLTTCQNCEPKYICVPSPPSKLHQIRFLKFSQYAEPSQELLTLSTEDGRVMLYLGISGHETRSAVPSGGDPPSNNMPLGQLIGYFGGKQSGIGQRIKDFEVIDVPRQDSTESLKLFSLVSSDGTIQIWQILDFEVVCALNSRSSDSKLDGDASYGKYINGVSHDAGPQQIGKLIGIYKTGSRITCLKVFRLSEPEAQAEQVAEEEVTEAEGDQDFAGFN